MQSNKPKKPEELLAERVNNLECALTLLLPFLKKVKEIPPNIIEIVENIIK